jgi:Tol biopolymer transport system component
VADQVRFDPLTGYTLLAASDEGLLAYVAGSPYDQELVWVDRTGGELGRVSEFSDYLSLRMSPDGSRAALNRSDPRSGRPRIWNLDLARGSMYPIDSQGVDWFPVWSPDGAKVVFSRAPGMELESAPATGGPSKLLATASGPAFPSDWSLDGRWLAYTGHSAATGAGVWILPMSEREIGMPRALIDSAHNEGGAVFSPANGKRPPAWISYTSNESGRDEVYVRSFPDAGAKIKVSISGGSRPLWRADGKEMYFVDSQGMLMALAVRNGHAMEMDAPRGLFRIGAAPAAPPYALNYTTRDGERFLVRKTRADGEVASIAILTHWHP